LRIAGSNGQQIFDADALAAIHFYSGGIPRVVNLLCEHCLVSAFVDQQHQVTRAIVEGVARDFDLADNPMATADTVMLPGTSTTTEKFDLVDALKTLANLADRLRESEHGLPKERKL
jgi:hypothetical protein